ncbi:hypothetical protein HXY33_01335 [Candidatus Bathyarchaeota archaeon]|nr:hypothetical protein [Candidatus Bathyarchaeota archaeon]
MQVYVVIASINRLENLKNLEDIIADYTIKVLVIDEGDAKIRRENAKILSSVPFEFYGPKEREQWFKDKFGQAFPKYLEIIPQRCHAETSFGFLRAYEDQAEVTLEIDDDVYISNGFLKEHLDNLSNSSGVTVSSSGKWYNTIDNLQLSTNQRVFPRGHPYSPMCRNENYAWTREGGRCVLNMGLWSGQPDLDALTILYHGGLDGRCKMESKGCKKEKIVLARGTYFAVCSMNTAFFTKIVPSFYQLYMNFLGVDRFDDIWSGVFLKRVADCVGDALCLGEPVGLHLKRSRNTFKDLKSEINGLDMNEQVWRMCEEAELSAKTYADCYLELADYIEKNVKKLSASPVQMDFWHAQTERMRKWVEVTDKIS